MKKKTTWKTLLGLGAAAVAFLRLSDDLQIHDLIPPPTPPTKRKPFVPVVGPGYKPPKPQCGYYEKAVLSYDAKLNVYSWRCVIDTSIPRVGGR